MFANFCKGLTRVIQSICNTNLIDLKRRFEMNGNNKKITINVNYNKPHMVNNGMNVFTGHPEIELTNEQFAEIATHPNWNNKHGYGYLWIGYADGTKSLLWAERRHGTNTIMVS